MLNPEPNQQPLTPVVPKRYLWAFILVTSLFALWGFANDVTNPLVAAFKDIFVISNAQSSWVQMAFYGGYATMAIPAALFISRFSYRSGIVVGLGLYAAGAFLCVPAAAVASFNLFLVALYILTFGLAFLETTANPYILAMGPKETATRRLNLAQAFNPVGSLTGMVVASVFILANLEVENFRRDVTAYQAEQKAVPSQEAGGAASALPIFRASAPERVRDPNIAFYVREHQGPEPLLDDAFRDYKTGTIQTFNGLTHAELERRDMELVAQPYLAVGCVVAILLLLFLVGKLPEPSSGKDMRTDSGLGATLGRLRRNPRYLGGVAAQAFYVGAQIMCWTFIIQYAQTTLGMDKATAQNHNIGAMLLFLFSRFICTWFLRFVNPARLLCLLALAAMTFIIGAIHLQGMPGLYSLILVSVCMSAMFPTIYGLALDGVGPDAKIGSSGLVLAIVGGAVMPRLQGGIMDMDGFLGVSAVRGSFYLPLLCFMVVAGYGILCHRVWPPSSDNR